MNMTAWGLTKVNGTVDLMGSDGMVMGMLKEGAAIEGIAMYWVAPEDYIGNRVSRKTCPDPPSVISCLIQIGYFVRGTERQLIYVCRI